MSTLPYLHIKIGAKEVLPYCCVKKAQTVRHFFSDTVQLNSTLRSLRQSASRAASRSLRNPEHTDGNIQLVPESAAPTCTEIGIDTPILDSFDFFRVSTDAVSRNGMSQKDNLFTKERALEGFSRRPISPTQFSSSSSGPRTSSP